jgi:ACS family sodium-dependent inorganic phosphate cotransporter
MSVAVIPMAAEFGWSPTVAGLVQSSFFYGYLLAQLPGGYLVSRVGGRAALPGGVALWSAATAAVPLLAGSLPGLFLSRAAVGLGEGIAPTAATDMVARIVAPGERSRAVAFVFGGLHVGSLLGLLIAPAVIEEFGWPAVFYAFGGIGLAWVAWWERTMAQVAADEPAVAAALAASKLQAAGGGAPVPWRAFLRSGPVRALAYTHFCNNWWVVFLIAAFQCFAFHRFIYIYFY